MNWLSTLGVLAAAAGLIATQRRLQRSQFNWIQAAVHSVNPQSYAALAASVDDTPDLANLEFVPEMLRPLCPAPPFVAAVYHHTCGSCRELWREIGTAEDLSSVHMVYSDKRTELLHRTGILRQPAVALPDEVMESLPSGLAIRVEADWRISDIQMATTTAELRQLLREPVGSP